MKEKKINENASEIHVYINMSWCTELDSRTQIIAPLLTNQISFDFFSECLIGYILLQKRLYNRHTRPDLGMNHMYGKKKGWGRLRPEVLRIVILILEMH